MGLLSSRRVLFLTLLAFTFPSGQIVSGQSVKGKRYALLVGVKDYEHQNLPALRYSERDVVELAKVLEAHRYRVTLLCDSEGAKEEARKPTLANIKKAYKDILQKSARADSVLLAFAGHGLQFEQDTDAFFCPVDARPFADRKDTLVSLKQVYKEMEESFAGVKLLFVDACRNDPKLARGARNGIDADNAPRPPRGVGALFSCSAGELAFENEKLRHGVFFHFLLEGLRGEAKNRNNQITFNSLADYINTEVSNTVPKLIGDGAKQSPQQIANLSGATPVLLEVTREAVNSIGMKMVRVPAGKFLMGSPKDEVDRREHEEQHEVEITKDFDIGMYEVTRGQFRQFIEDTRYQTQNENEDGVGFVWNPDLEQHERHKLGYSWRKVAWEQTDDHPVVLVSWHDIHEFCRWLSKKEKKYYRLPTDAEWEYACRAGSKTTFFWGDHWKDIREHANVADASMEKKAGLWLLAWNFTSYAWDDGFPFTAPVGRFRPNDWGLYDMCGNVLEWTGDVLGPIEGLDRKDPFRLQTGTGNEYMIMRGGGFNVTDRSCRSAFRTRSFGPAARADYAGFRVVCEP